MHILAHSMGLLGTHGGEDLGRVVVDRVLARPLLEDEDDNSNHEPDEVALPQERLAQPEPLARLALLLDRSLDLSHLRTDRLVVDVSVAQIREVGDGLLVAPLGRQPARRLFHGKEPEGHDPRGDELEAEGDSPDVRPGGDVQADAHCGTIGPVSIEKPVLSSAWYSRLMKYEIMTPMATMIWNRPVIRPRTSFGEHSDTYAGATAEIAPTPTPATTRPA